MSSDMASTERKKYEEAWARPEYRAACHSLELWRTRKDLFPASFSSALDIGCGRGLLLDLWNKDSIDAWGLDIAPNCLDCAVADTWRDRVLFSPLWDFKIDKRFDLGICTDVMEHLPTEHVAESLRRIADCCDEVLFKIAHVPDVCGGGSYHLTVQPAEWWLDKIRSHGGIVEHLGYVNRSGYQDSLIRWTVLEPSCLGRRCSVIGSSLGLVLPEVGRDDRVLAANGGAGLARGAGLPVDVLCTTSHLFGDGATEAEMATRSLMQGVEVRFATWVDERCGPSTAVEWDRCGISSGHVRRTASVLRSKIVTAACGGDLWVSTGVFAVCLALLSGAAQAVVVGISGKARDHADADSECLGLLKARWGEKLEVRQ